MSENNRLWHEMVSCAIEIQQQYYELLPDWTIYGRQDYDILQQNIGYALFGPPTESRNVDNTENNTNSSNLVVSYISENADQLTNINEGIRYNETAMKIITVIYNQIIEYGKQLDGSISCGIIYNIIFDIPAKKNVDIDKNDIMREIQAVPIFKIKNCSPKSSSENIQYIDNNGRVYENWINYKTNNTLPACIMVIPNGGFYQPNQEFPITEISSTVWVEVCPSPASSLSAQFVTGVDTASTVLNVGGLGIAVASMLTPIGPAVALAGLATTGVSSAWTFGRSIYHLYDRHSHRESVSPTNRSALSAWLGIAGCTMGLATSGGNILLSRAATVGQEIGLGARIVYNTTVIGNMSINLIGLGYSGYNIVENYQNGNSINLSDVFFFTTHAMFFGNAILATQFAHDVINISRGNVMSDFEATLRNRRHRRAYNRVRRNATSDAEIVRYVRRVQTRRELLSTTSSNQQGSSNLNNIQRNGSRSSANQSSGSQPNGSRSSGSQPNSSQSSGSNVTRIINDLSFKGGKVKIRNTILLDPLIFMTNYKESTGFRNAALLATGSPSYTALCAKLLKLLTNYYNDNPLFKTISTVPEFESILSEIQYMENSENILDMVFSIAIKLADRSLKMDPHLVKIVRFVWEYGKKHLVEMGIDAYAFIINSSVNETLTNIIKTIYDEINGTLVERNKFEVEGDDRGRKHRYVTSLPVKYQSINVSGDVTKIEVVLEEAPDDTVLAGSIPSELNASIEFNSTYPGGIPETGTVVVRAEEALIVVLVLFLWVAAIALFFNRWGKIRMLEPYQPKFQQQHRQSCTMVDMNALTDHPVHQGSCVVTSTTAECWRPRQNSVFVGSSSASLVAVDQETPRRAKSAFDLQSLVLAECNVRSSFEDEPANPSGTGTSLSLETSKFGGQRRTSVCHLLDKPLQQRERGMSVCQVDRGDYQILQSKSSQRDRGMSICYFDRTDVLARPLQRDHRGSSICHFDRMDVLARPPFRDRGTSVSQFDRMDVLARPTSSYLDSCISVILQDTTTATYAIPLKKKKNSTIIASLPSVSVTSQSDVIGQVEPSSLSSSYPNIGSRLSGSNGSTGPTAVVVTVILDSQQRRHVESMAIISEMGVRPCP
ncbi:hypothetical protein M0802_006056 [Mischocyttarus mexicanus]|nr:hypothetical protein M0802_006056 [Mischocyttarus mexicanus]